MYIVFMTPILMEQDMFEMVRYYYERDFEMVMSFQAYIAREYPRRRWPKWYKRFLLDIAQMSEGLE